MVSKNSIRFISFRQSLTTSLIRHCHILVGLIITSVVFRSAFPQTTVIFETTILLVILALIIKDLTNELYIFTANSVIIFNDLLSQKPKKIRFQYEQIKKIRTKSTNPLFENIEIILDNTDIIKLKYLSNTEHVGELLLDIKNSSIEKRKQLLKIHRLRKTKSIKDYQLTSN